MNPLSIQVTISRLQLAGVIPITTTAVISEILKSWKHTDAAKYAHAHALSLVMPNYQALIEIYYKA